MSLQSSVKLSEFITLSTAARYRFLLNTCGVCTAHRDALSGVASITLSVFKIFIVSLTLTPVAAACVSNAASSVLFMISAVTRGLAPS